MLTIHEILCIWHRIVINIHFGTFSSGILCLNTLFPLLLQPFSFDYSQYEKHEIFVNSTCNEGTSSGGDDDRKISYVNCGRPLLLCLESRYRSSGLWRTRGEVEWADSTACIWWIFKTPIPGINTEWKLKREIISLHSVGSINDLYIYFTNK